MKEKSLLNVLEGFEALVTELLLWLVFIPRTLFKIIADPNWVSSYIEAELKEKDQERFDGYISPILLFLVTSLVLFVILNTLNFESGNQRIANIDRLVTELKGNQGILAGLGFLSLPLLFSLATELFRGANLTRKGFQRIFYIQCYYFSPLTLALFAFILLVNLLPEDEFMIVSSSFFLLVPVFIWFLIVEVKVIAQELKSKTRKTLKAIGVLSLCTIVILFGAIILLEFSAGTEINAFNVGLTEVIRDRPLPNSGKFSIVIQSVDNSTGDYRLTLRKDSGTTEHLLEDTEGSSLQSARDSSNRVRFITYGESVEDRVAADASSVWTFEGSEGDNIFIMVEPLDLFELDVAVDVLDATGNSIMQDEGVFNFTVGSIGFFYIVAIGWAVVLGFWSIFRKPKEAVTQNEEAAE